MGLRWALKCLTRTLVHSKCSILFYYYFYYELAQQTSQSRKACILFTFSGLQSIITDLLALIRLKSGHKLGQFQGFWELNTGFLTHTPQHFQKGF